MGSPDGVCTGLSDFNQLARLGEGAFSVVYKVLRLADRSVYALKMVKLPSLKDKEKQNALNEVRLLASVQHENIIAYKEAFFDDRSRCLCIVTEFADGGDLFQQITKCQKERTRFRETEVWRYLHGMLHGLKALHDMKILHRDLKCANVFLSATRDGCIAKLGDFNVSKVAKRGLCLTQTGTPYYASPEVWRDMPYDAKSDMWSIGCVLYETLALKPPFQAEDMEGLYRKVLKGQYPRIPQQYSNDLAEVVSILLQVNPRHRPSVDQLLQTPVMLRHALPSTNQSVHNAPCDLLQTIKLPSNAIDLTECLPKPRYESQLRGSGEKSVAESPQAAAVNANASRRPPQVPPNPLLMPPSAQLAQQQQQPQQPQHQHQHQHQHQQQPSPREGQAEASAAALRAAGAPTSDILDAYIEQQMWPPAARQPQQGPGQQHRQHQQSGAAPLRRGPSAENASAARLPSLDRRVPPEATGAASVASGSIASRQVRGGPLGAPQRGLPGRQGGGYRAVSGARGGQPTSADGSSVYDDGGASQAGGASLARHATPHHARSDRRPMADYARAQYAQPQRPPPPEQPASRSRGLRLPRIFG